MREVYRKLNEWAEKGGPFQPHIERSINRCFAALLFLAAVLGLQCVIAFLKGGI